MRVVLVGALIASCASPQPAPVVTRPPEVVDTTPTLRLPRTFTPTRYAARLAVDPARTEFTGSIAITGTIAAPARELWLHGEKLTVRSAVATLGSESITLQVTPVRDELLKLVPERALAAGEWTLTLEYAGTLETQASAGAFRQTVGNDAYVFTQLEAIYARRVFPCFDEPDSKVPWQLTLDVPSALVAVSNTPIAREEALAEGVKRVEFAPTKPLPTYLVAFGVGPFAIVDAGTSKRGTPVRVFALNGRAADAAYAAQTSARMLDLAEDWFGTPYPYEKLDMLTIPVTVGFGAMENAGLITYTEELILHDAKASKRRKRNWISTAAHEIAHQWFGNLVTMGYWDDIWLNEGFANWVQTKISDAFEPAWHELDGVLEMRNRALEADSLITARQIQQPIERTDDILNAFDGITYNKGASVLGMFEAYVGPEVFQRGVREHLRAHAFANATSADFAQTIAAAAGQPELATAFATFLDQPGAPEITATIACGAQPTIQLAQRRYVPPGAAAPGSTRPWHLPVCVRYDAGGTVARACTLLTAATGTIALPTQSCPRWVMPNAGATGYYRVAYTTPQLLALRDEAWSQLTWTERRAVFFDAKAALRTGAVPLAIALSLVPPMLLGNDRYTLPAAVNLPGSFDEWVPDALRAKYEYWLRKAFGAAALTVGVQPAADESLDAESVRSALLDTIAWTAREPALVAQAVALADTWRDLPQSIRESVLTLAVDAKPALFDQVLAEVVREPLRTRRTEMLAALASVRDVARQTRALQLLLNPAIDAREAIWMLYRTSTVATRDNAQAFLRDNFAAVAARLPSDSTSSSLGSLSSLFTDSCDAAQRDAIARYVTTTFAAFPGAARVVKQNIEQMDQCIARRRVIAPEIEAWLGGVKILKDGDGDKPEPVDEPEKKKKKKRKKK